jgi:outer membrane protein OmpA-like peptidoglycan-associated protein
MNTLTKAITILLAGGAVGFAVNSHAAVKCAPGSATSAQAAASCTQPVAYPGYYGGQGQWQPHYYNYGYQPWGGNWTPRRGDSNDYDWDSRNRWNNRDRWKGDNRWFNRGWGDYDSYVDTFGNLKFEMDFDLDFDWDVDADADVDSDADTDFESSSNYRGRNANRFYNRYYNRNYPRYYDGYYRGYGPYNYYNYNYGYSYPYTAAPRVVPAPQQQPAAPAEQETDFARADVTSEGPTQPINVDDDNDRVLNSSDFCPNTAAGAVVDSFGCTIAEPIVLRGVNFHTDSDRLTQESMAILDGVAATLRAHPELKLEVSGHTDSDAEDNYNRDLSQRRAERVREYLIGKGASAGNLTARGYGEERPIASNQNAAGKALNRRVELNRY